MNTLSGYYNAIRNGSRDLNIISDYYGFLASRGYTYGTLAQGVVDNNTMSGIMARAFAEQHAAESNVLIDWNELSAGLMLADFEARSLLHRTNNDNVWLGVDIIREYHNTVFESLGLSRDAWTAELGLFVMDDLAERQHLWDVMLDTGGNPAEMAIAFSEFQALVDREGHINPFSGNGARAELGEFALVFLYGSMLANAADEAVIQYARTRPQEFRENIDHFRDAVEGWLGPCFAAGTLVRTINGYSKKIEDLVVGDEVAAFPENHPFATLERCKVVSIKRSWSKDWYRIIYDGHVTIVTGNHPFLTSNMAFSAVEDLYQGDDTEVVLVNEDGNEILCKLEQVRDPETLSLEYNQTKGIPTYNIEVERHHTYIANGFRVHNECSPDVIRRRQRLLTSLDNSIILDALATYSTAGGVLGSAIGNALFDSTVGRLVGVPMLGAVGAVVGASLGATVTSGITVSDAVRATLSDLPSQLGQGLHNSAVGAVSSYLTAELMQSIGVDGTAGEILGIGAGSTLNSAYTNIVNGTGWSAGFDPANFFADGSKYISGYDAAGEPIASQNPIGVGSLVAGALASYVGSKLSSALVSPYDATAAKWGAVVGAFGSWVGGSIGSAFGPIGRTIGSGVGQFLGQTIGTLWGNATGTGKLLGAATFFMTGSLLFSGIILSLFGKKRPPIPSADAESVLNLDRGYYELGSVSQVGGGNVEFVESMAQSATDSLNGIIAAISYDSRITNVANVYSPTQTYGHTADEIWVKLGSSNHKEFFDSGDNAVDYGVMWAIKQTKIVGGDIFLKRVINQTQSESVIDVWGDLKVAQDYSKYVRNRDFYDAAIVEPYDSLSESDRTFLDNNQGNFVRVMAAPRNADGEIYDDGTGLALSGSTLSWYNTYNTDANGHRVDTIIEGLAPSQFAAGWIITLQRAEEMGLNRTSRSDFYGGFAGFADSLQILNLTDDALTLEAVGIRMDGNTMEVRWDEDENGWTSAPSGDQDLFSLVEIYRDGGFAKMTAGAVDASTANGRSLAMDLVANAHSASFIFGSGGRNTAGDDLIVTWGSTGVSLDDHHRETWRVDYSDPSGGGGGPAGPTVGDPESGEAGEGGSRLVEVTITGGNDVFKTWGGNDTLRGRGGNDWLDAGDGNDTLYGDSGDDVLFGRGGVDLLEGGSGNDYLSAGSGHYDTLRGGDGDDTLVGGRNRDYVYGGNGNDLVIVDADTSVSDYDFYDGQAGEDMVSFERVDAAIALTLSSSFDWTIPGAPGRDRFRNFSGLRGSVHDDRLYGDAARNTLEGIEGDDTLSAGGGRDTIQGGAGADLLSGGGDWDTATYAASNAAVWIDLTAQEAFGGHAEGDTFLYNANGRADVEYLEGSDFADTFKGNVGQHNQFWGGKGDDWFVVTAGNERYHGEEDFDTVDYSELTSGVTVRMTDGYDNWNVLDGTNRRTELFDIEHVVGTDHTDRFFGRNGEDDTFTGGRGTDHLQGYSGNDTYVYNRGDGLDYIYETADGGGWDVLMMGEDLRWNDLKFHTPGSFTTAALDIRVDGSTSQRIYVADSFDTRTGYNEGGIDAIDIGGTGAIYINEINLATALNDSDNAVQGAHSDRRDLLLGYGGHDRIYSNRSNGSYATHWEDNDNLLIGGRGNDRIYASVGDDTYVFEAGDGFDRVKDVGGEDRIQFGAGIRAEDILFERAGDDLIVGIHNGQDTADFAAYVRRHGDLLNAYNGSHSQGQISGNTIEEFGRFHWEVSGRAEGRSMTYIVATDVTAATATDRIRIEGGAHQSTTIEYVTAGGVDINLLTLDGIDWASSSGGAHMLPVLFDLDNDGTAGLISVEASTVGVGASGTRLGWFGPSDGVLALDRNEDGVIDRAGEISFRSDLEGATTDMEGLVAYDTDGDGALTSGDEGWSRFSVWQDLNQDGVSSDGELRTLDQVGIASIGLDLQATGSTDANSADSVVLNTASATLAGGGSMTVFDTAFGLAGPLTDDDLAGSLGFSQVAALDLGPEVVEGEDALRHTIKAIMVDLDGNGFDTIDVTHSALGTDMNDDGIRDRVGWLQRSDGFLVTDANGDGRITVGEDLVETHRDLDSDRLLRGDVLQQIRKLSDDYLVWRDDNQDGIGDEGELFTFQELEDRGIATDLYDRIRAAQHPHSTTESPIQGIAVDWFEGTTERDRLDYGIDQEGAGGASDGASFARQRLDALRAAAAEQAAAEPKADAVLGTPQTQPSAGDVAPVSGPGGTIGADVDTSPANALRGEASFGARPSRNESRDASDEIAAGSSTAPSGGIHPSSRWWLSDLRDRQTLRGRDAGLTALLSSLDAEKAGTDDPAPRMLPRADRDALAERQRLLQAMAAFHGSSGAAGMRSPGEDGVRQSAMERLGVSPKGSISQNAFF